jgi:hypothetical protein
MVAVDSSACIPPGTTVVTQFHDDRTVQTSVTAIRAMVLDFFQICTPEMVQTGSQTNQSILWLLCGYGSATGLVTASATLSI